MRIAGKLIVAVLLIAAPAAAEPAERFERAELERAATKLESPPALSGKAGADRLAFSSWLERRLRAIRRLEASYRKVLELDHHAAREWVPRSLLRVADLWWELERDVGPRRTSPALAPIFSPCAHSELVRGAGLPICDDFGAGRLDFRARLGEIARECMELARAAQHHSEETKRCATLEDVSGRRWAQISVAPSALPTLEGVEPSADWAPSALVRSWSPARRR